MLQLKDNKGKLLPKKVRDRVNNFIDNLKNIPWFKSDKNIKKEDVDKQINFTLECFGVKAGIEYRILKEEKDLDSTLDFDWNSAWDFAWNYAKDSALDFDWDSAWISAWIFAWDSAWIFAWDSAMDDSSWVYAWNFAWNYARTSALASAEILVIDKIKDKYPNGAFIQLFKLWEMGLYPYGIINGKFVVYSTQDFWSNNNETECNCDCAKKIKQILELIK